MALPTCSLSILVARTDVLFMMKTIPHIVKMCNYPFSERLLAVDTAPLTGDKVSRPGVGTMEQLRQCCDRLLTDGVVDRVVDINYSPAYRRQVYRKHLGSSFIRPTHNYKGYPILGTIFSLEEVASDYILHFDSDMLLYQDPDYNWIQTGIKLLQQHKTIIAARPLAGPPCKQTLLQQEECTTDLTEFCQFPTLGSRVYLIDRKRFNNFLPLPVLWRPFKTQFINVLPETAKSWLNYFTNRGKLGSWEVMFSNRLRQTSCVRINLTSPKAWTLHPKVRGTEFIQALPQIIEKVELGWYPPEQGGNYDLNLVPWLEALRAEAIGNCSML